MRFTNRENFPAWMVRTLTADNYARGAPPFDISATGLIDSPLKRHLMFKHKDEVTQDALDMLPAVIGTGFHNMAQSANENAADVVCEKRLYFEVDGYTISAQYDVYERQLARLNDIKTTSVWSIIFDKGSQWAAQLNVQGYAARQNDMDIESLQIAAVLKDWSRSKRFDDGYPRNPIVFVDVPLWPEHQARDYIRERLKAHFEDEPTCSDEERWKKPDKYAVMKKGRKSAVRVLDSEESAIEYMEDKCLNGEHSITHRVGGYTRCADYCSVKDFCPLNPNPF